MINIVAVGLGGFLGAVCRYIVSEQFSVSSGFPIATLLINWIGCFILAYILAKASLKWSQPMKLAVTTGFLGGFTTFSTFSLEAFLLIESGEIVLSFLYIAASIFGGLCFSWIGLLLAKGGRVL